MQLLKDAHEQFDSLPFFIKFILYVGTLILLWKSFPWLLQGLTVVGFSLLTFFCLCGLSSDSYNIAIQSFKTAGEKILQDALEDAIKKEKAKEETA